VSEGWSSVHWEGLADRFAQNWPYYEGIVAVSRREGGYRGAD
jgi:hypothetical protein